MTVRRDAASGEFVLPLSGNASKHADALAAIVEALSDLNGGELQRVIQFARELRERGEHEFVWFGLGPSDVSIDEAIIPGQTFLDVWRGYPQIFDVDDHVILKGPLNQPAVIHYHEPKPKPELHARHFPTCSYLVLGPGPRDAAEHTKLMHFTTSLYSPTRRLETTESAPENMASGTEPGRQSSEVNSAEGDDVAWTLRRELLSESIPVAEAARLIGRTEQTAINRAKAKEMLGIRDGVRWMFPGWQFDAKHESGLVPGLTDVLQAVDAPSFSVALWLRAPSPVLDARRPIDALRSGDIDGVLATARSLGSQ
jgi:hypothetical protein